MKLWFDETSSWMVPSIILKFILFCVCFFPWFSLVKIFVESYDDHNQKAVAWLDSCCVQQMGHLSISWTRSSRLKNRNLLNARENWNSTIWALNFYFFRSKKCKTEIGFVFWKIVVSYMAIDGFHYLVVSKKYCWFWSKNISSDIVNP